MRNIFLFIWKKNFFLLFLILQIIALLLLAQNNNHQKASVVNSSNTVAGTVYEVFSSVTDYFNLREENEKLVAENTALHNKSSSSFTDFSAENFTVNNPVYRQQYSFIMANVVNNSVNRRNNYLTLNRGSEQGVTKDMAVICPQGIVGVVKDISENFCTVMSLLHKNSIVPIAIKKFDEPGSLNWNGHDPDIGTIYFVPSHLKIAKGDTVVTSHLSAFFPPGILAGTVESYELVSGKNFYTVTVRFSTDFHRLKHVYIVNNIFRQEQAALENATQHDK